MSQRDHAATFRNLHTGTPLVLPNAWDPASACMIERAGASAIATASAGVSWAHGRCDGHGLERGPAIEAIRRIVEVVGVPVTADVEGGYGTETPADVIETVGAVLEAGAVGINLEDSSRQGGDPLWSIDAQTARIRAARTVAEEQGIDLFINARTDIYLAQVGEPTSRLPAVLTRAAAYVAAGADGVFVPGVVDSEIIAALVAGIEAPVNIMVLPGVPTVPELAALGVARVSLGPGIMLGALGFVEQAAKEVLTTGTYGRLGRGPSFADVNGWFARS